MNSNIKQKIISLDRPVPRYTSYPTAPNFQPGFSSNQSKIWLRALPVDSRLSLYFHIPFCPKLCWFCGCNTKITKRYAPVQDYLHLLMREIEMIGKLCADSRKATNIHFGGGSPTMLSAVDFSRLMSCVRDVFNVSKDAEIAIEIDPRQMSEAKAASYAKAGVTRASLGVQDFDQKVLQAVNRAQPFHASYETVTVLREYEINKINLDLIYGLPHQTTKTIKKTAEYALLLKPDRIALFGYAHVPWMKKHMRLIPAQALPDALTRLELFEAASEIFCAAGYVPIGIDHFAKPDDPLAEAKASRNLHRNFQGYTDDQCDALIGFGVSAISRLPAGFVQNSPQMSSYRAAILDRNPPVAKFSPLSDEDKLRGDIIQSLMCNFQADIASICRKHGYAADYFKNEVGTLKTLRDSGLINLDDSGTINILAPQAARFACAAFDAYLQPAEIARHVTAT